MRNEAQEKLRSLSHGLNVHDAMESDDGWRGDARLVMTGIMFGAVAICSALIHAQIGGWPEGAEMTQNLALVLLPATGLIAGYAIIRLVRLLEIRRMRSALSNGSTARSIRAAEAIRAINPDAPRLADTEDARTYLKTALDAKQGEHRKL